MIPSSTPESDSAAMNRALRWAVVALVLIAGAAFYFLSKGGQIAPARAAGALPEVTASLSAEVPRATFRDVTTEAGIKFTHASGARGEKLLPETMGGGCAFVDFDSDGDQDIVLVNSGDWPWTENGRTGGLVLYRNDGTGRFAEAGTIDGFYGMGIAAGDYDNDGRTDLFATAVGGNRLFHNDGEGRFSDVTGPAGVGGAASSWSTGAAWLDIDNDGDLDLFVANYIRWSRELDLANAYTLVGIGRAYGPPMNFAGTFPTLYRNEGSGHFVDVSAASGVQVSAQGQPAAKSLGVAPVDLDNDGWIDLLVANDTAKNFVFHNERNGTFKEIGELTGAAFDSYGKVRGAMGIDAARFGPDHSLAISIGNFANEMTALYVAQRDPLVFTDEALTRGIGNASRDMLTFGVFFFDYDLDGRLDLLTTNGHLEEQIARVHPKQSYRQPPQLFWNARGSIFVPVPAEKAGDELFAPIVGRGSAFADIDGDGDLDVLLAQVGGPARLLRNEQSLGHRWTRLKLMGTKSNRDAIGAWIKLRTNQQTLWRQVMPTRGYLAQSELPVTFGLGSAERIEEAIVVWPGGGEQKIDGLRLDETKTIKQP